MAELGVLTFDEFRRFLSQNLGVAEQALAPETNLLYDLGVESLKMLELMIQFEVQLGVHVPSDVAWEIGTVKDAYRYYADNARQQAIAVAPAFGLPSNASSSGLAGGLTL